MGVPVYQLPVEDRNCNFLTRTRVLVYPAVGLLAVVLCSGLGIERLWVPKVDSFIYCTQKEAELLFEILGQGRFTEHWECIGFYYSQITS